MASREMNIVIKAKNLAGPAIKSVKSELKGLGKDVSKGLKNAWGNIEKGVALGATAAGGAIAYAVKQAGDFQASLNTINTVAGLSQDQLTAVGDSIREMARKSGTPLEDLTGAYYDLVSAGVSATDAQNVLTQANTLAIGGLGSTAETVDLLTTAINSYGGDASKAKEFTDQFAVAIANGKVTASELAANFAEVGPLAAALGVGVDQISASIGNMTAKGTHAPEAFTQIRAAMVALQRQTPDLKKVLKKLGIKDVEKELGKKGLAGTWNELAAEAKKLGIPLIKLTGRVEGQQYVLQNTGDAWDDYSKNLEDVHNASDGAGEAAKQMAERQKGLNFQLDRLKANAKDAAITLGTAIIPKILPLFEKANAWIDKNQDRIKTFAGNVADGVAKAVEWASSLDWEGIGNSLKMAADFSKGLVEAFLSMPDWVKQAVITGWGLNKLTGGAVASIFGGIVGSVAKAAGQALFQKLGLMTVQAGVVNVNGGIGGGGGGPGGGTPVAAGGSAATRLLAAGGVVLGGIVIGSEVAKAANASTINPAKNFEQAGFQSTIANDNNIKSLQTKLDAIDSNLRTTIFDKGFDPLKNATEFLQDPLKAIAVSLSGAPIVGDALGNLQPELKAQRDAIVKKIEELKRSQTTTDGILQHNASEHNAVITQTNAKLAQLNQHASSNAAKTAAMLAASRESAAKLAAIPPHLRNIASADAQTARYTGVTSRKNFSPHFTANVVTHISSQVRLSVNAMATKLTSQHISSQAGVTGGLIE